MMVYFARALGGARGGNPAAGEKDVKELQRIVDALKSAKDNYWGYRSRGPAARRCCMDRLCERQPRRSAPADALRGRHGGPEREERRYSGTGPAR